MSLKKTVNSLFLGAFIVISFISCTEKKPTPKPQLTGAGSSFALPFEDRLFRIYKQLHRGNIKYTPNNSYQGITEFLSNKTDFALSIIPLTDEQIQQNPNVLHIPITVAGVNFAYNIPSEGFSPSDDPVYLTPDLITRIMLGTITNWNDPAIVSLNQKVSQMPDRVFPDLPITVIHRDGIAGDSLLFSRFLTKASPLWARRIGETNIIDRIGLGATNSLDVMRLTLQTPGAFSYTTMIYGVQNNIPLIRVQNKLGTFGRGCTFRSTEAMKVATPTTDNIVDLTYPSEGKDAAVATAFIYLIVRQEQNYNNRTKEQAHELVNFIDWLLSPEAQRELEPIFFATLTQPFRNAARNTLNSITYDGTAVTPTKTKKQ